MYVPVDSLERHVDFKIRSNNRQDKHEQLLECAVQYCSNMDLHDAWRFYFIE